MNKLNEELLRSSVRAFEGLGFLLPSEDVNTVQQAAPLEVECAVRFHGPSNGKVRVRLFGGLIRTLAENMLGEDAVLEPDAPRQAVQEVVNVVCGTFLPALAGPEAIFDLDVPVVGVETAPPRSPSAEVTFGLEEGRAEVALFLDAPEVCS
jgi:CheY-specific phosphatase CheX